jgi:hypothetical protein
VTAWLVAAALVVWCAAVAALAAGEPRLALVGLAAVLIGAAVLADPLPAPAILGARLAAALLSVAVLRAAAPAPTPRRDSSADDPPAASHLGWPAAVLFGAAGAAAGLAVVSALPAFVPVVGNGTGWRGIGGGGLLDAPSLAFGIGCALVTLALPALTLERLGWRRAVAAVLLVQAAVLLRVGLAGPPGPVEEVVLGALLIAVAAAAALLASAARAAPERGGHPGATSGS